MNKKSILYLTVGFLAGILVWTLIFGTRSASKTIKVNKGDWQKLNLVLNSIEQNYVDTIDYEKITTAAITGVLNELDPHSVYLEPQVLKESEDDLAGNFDGIGIQFNVPSDTAVVIEVIPGGPAEKIGMLAGDRILKVGDKVIAGVKFPQDSMVRRMKGPAGTKVTVTVGRGKEVIPFEITRGKIPTHSVDAAFMVNDSVAYLRLSKFARTTVTEVTEATDRLLNEGMRKLIFDLRENTGGFLDQALLLANMFLDRGDLIVYMEGIHREKNVYRADGRGKLKEIPLTVLIDGGSASSSEIFAGAIQDNDRGVIVGRRSFGKGLVQEPIFFSDGSGVRLTVARFHTPSGRCIQKPYSDDYGYEVYERYNSGEMLAADSIKVDTSLTYNTVSGRTVYGGGGIIPDVFVPVDTSKVSPFFVSCNRKAVAMRFASAYFDSHKAELQSIASYDRLLSYLDSADLERKFLAFAKEKENLVPDAGWASDRPYMMAQIRALVGRYSKLGDNAFYHLYLKVDRVFEKAMEQV